MMDAKVENIFRQMKEKSEEYIKNNNFNLSERSNEEFIEDVFEEIFSSIKGYKGHCYGATKICFYFKGIDYVFKIPFNINEFGDYFNDDYCMLEEDNYNYSKGYDKISNIFVKTEFIGFLDEEESCPVYIQPLVPVTGYRAKWDYLTFNTSSQRRKAMKIRDELGDNDLPIDFLASCVRKYGENTAKQLYEFLMNFEINDITWYNCGCTDQGKPVIFDYSGYKEED